MRKVLLAVGFAAVVLLVGGSSGLGTVWLFGGAALAAGFGWMLGGTPVGPSGPDNYAGDGPDGSSG
jgi:hypothetical protein